MNRYLPRMRRSGSISLISLLGLVAIVLLVISLNSYARNQHVAIPIDPINPLDHPIIGTSTGDTADTTRYAQKCGLTISFPTIGTTASFPLQIKGVIDNKNYKTKGCSWTSFEGQAGVIHVYANINNTGWKLVSKQSGDPHTTETGWVPLMTETDWTAPGPISVSALVMLGQDFLKIPAKTPMKVVIDEEDPSGMGGERLEIPFVYSGENVEQTALIIHQPINDHPTDCGQTYKVTRFVPKTTAVADAAMRVLLAETYPDIKDYYNGVTIKNGVATVDFDAPALKRLNASACIQAITKNPIENTLKEFPTIKSVEYSIDGKLFDQWDA